MDKDSLKKHVLAIHQDTKMFKCPFCSKEYGYEKNMKAHLLQKHSAMSTAGT